MVRFICYVLISGLLAIVHFVCNQLGLLTKAVDDGSPEFRLSLNELQLVILMDQVSSQDAAADLKHAHVIYNSC